MCLHLERRNCFSKLELSLLTGTLFSIGYYQSWMPTTEMAQHKKRSMWTLGLSALTHGMATFAAEPGRQPDLKVETLIGDFQGKLDLVEEARFACIQDENSSCIPKTNKALKWMLQPTGWGSFHFEGQTNYPDCHFAKPPSLCLSYAVVLCSVKPHQSLQVLNSGMDVFAHNVETVTWMFCSTAGSWTAGL